jgi:cystathionine beta-lyase family protein involved in aluminum resistance
MTIPAVRRLKTAYALAFGAEKALVRIQISAGTQALSLCLYSLLRPGDTLLSVTGLPYDTLTATIGLTEPGSDAPDGSLADLGVRFASVDLLPDGSPDLAAVAAALANRPKVVFIQKSRGYTTRRSLTIDDIAAVVRTVREIHPAAIVLVDNCYGEFVEDREPCMVAPIWSPAP